MLKALGIATLSAALSSQAWSQPAGHPQMKLNEDSRVILAVATSLIEATATIAVGRVLSGAAVGAAIDAVNDSKVQAAIGDVSAIGQAIATFLRGNGFPPLYKYGNRTGPADPFFSHLVSENGTYPTDSSPGRYWGIALSPMTWQASMFFGHKPDPNHDSIEGQLMRNQLGGDQSQRYLLRGAYVGDPARGWAGPYIAVLPKTDPWGNKYLVNIREMQSAHAQDPAFAGIHGGRQIAVFVLSAGPNRTIDTSAEQSFDTFTVTGDDIVFRVK